MKQKCFGEIFILLFGEIFIFLVANALFLALSLKISHNGIN